MTHFNIGLKKEINPFEKVTHILLGEHSEAREVFKPVLDKICKNPGLVFRNDSWDIIYPIELLNFVTLIKWFEPFRGTFIYKNKTIHFRIENELFIVW